jgi:hypothetical protein
MDEDKLSRRAARLQLETAVRSVSVAVRVKAVLLRDGNQIELVGKGGTPQTFTISSDLQGTLSLYLAQCP